jgi:hypothetical protein
MKEKILAELHSFGLEASVIVEFELPEDFPVNDAVLMIEQVHTQACKTIKVELSELT